MTERLAYCAVACGSALGGMGRFWLAQLMAQRFRDSFPWGILVVNVSGSFLIGLFSALIGPGGRFHPRFHGFILHFLMAGVCGGYTTFSTFSLQTFRLMQSGEWVSAGSNIGLSVALCLLGVWAGFAVGHWLNR